MQKTMNKRRARVLDTESQGLLGCWPDYFFV